MDGKKILIGVTGGIAAYKAVEVVSRLKKKNCEVRVVMTQNATEFVAPLTFESLSKNPVYTQTFNQGKDWEIHHISLAKWADAVIVAPMTANVIGKVANGISDDLLTTVLMATEKPIFVVPAMNTGMYENLAVQANMQTLKNRGAMFIDAESGLLACGDVGKGRMAEPYDIVQYVESWFNKKMELKGKHVLITAGPTREYIDPVRFISNPSSGKMGYALAQACVECGAQVTLVSGPVHIDAPSAVTVIPIETTKEMNDAVMQVYSTVDMVFATAAVSDYRPKYPSTSKIKKESNNHSLCLDLERTTDILANMGMQKEHQVLVGFAAETDNIEENAKAKLKRKHLDYIVANDVTAPNAGFEVDTNKGTLFTHLGETINLPQMNKLAFARMIVQQVIKRWEKECSEK